jgi:hypothetical protein
MMTKICKVENCEREAKSRGFCFRCYQRLRYHEKLTLKQSKDYGTPEERFRRKYKVNLTTGCWEWTKSLNHDGYGEFILKQGRILAHRFSYALFKSHLNKEQRILHICDNRRCVNPKHLKIGTQQENIKDMVVKDRHAKHKLNLNQAIEIKNSSLNRRELAVIYNVSITTIRSIKKELTWKRTV